MPMFRQMLPRLWVTFPIVSSDKNLSIVSQKTIDCLTALVQSFVNNYNTCSVLFTKNNINKLTANNMKNNRKNNNGGGSGHKHYQRQSNSRQENFKQAKKKNGRFGGGKKNFPKFVDNEHSNNQSIYWKHNDDNNIFDNSFQNNGHTDAGIVPWFRKNPINPLFIPRQHLNFENNINNEERSLYKNDTENGKDNVQMIVENPITLEKSDKGNSASITTTVPKVSEPPKIPVETNFSVKIEQKTDLARNLKQERKSSSSSSSSSESSSSEEETEFAIKPPVVSKTEMTSTSKAPSSPLNIKLKPKITPANSTPVKPSQKLQASPESSSSFCSSSSSDEELPKNQESVIKKQEKPISSKNKNNSEDDVVCIGNLENKIVLEDESDEEDVDDNVENEKPTKKVLTKKYKTSAKKTSEKCMICDKKGHTSFECQMICKNCSTPYHSYRTCPQPANLNTMLQMFMEFCMQQIQHFSTENAIHPTDNVPKPQIDSLNSTGASNKSKNLKRKLSKASKSNKKTKSSKKRKLHISKKTKSKNSSDDSSDEEDSDENDSDSETSLEEIEDESSDSPVESVVSSKKKLKIKNKTTCSKTTSKLSNCPANPANLPIVLNGFPNLTVPTVSVQSPNTSTNALNTLLLTQMIQNAIGSLKQ